MNCNIKKFKKVTNADYLRDFSNTIHNNFLDLKGRSGLEHSIPGISRILKSDHCIGYTLEIDNKTIGYLVGELIAIPDGRIVYYISYFYIASKYRGKGLGKALFEKCIKECYDQGFRFIMLLCNREKKIYSFYKNNGFMEDPVQKSELPYVVLTKYL